MRFAEKSITWSALPDEAREALQIAQAVCRRARPLCRSAADPPWLPRTAGVRPGAAADGMGRLGPAQLGASGCDSTPVGKRGEHGRTGHADETHARVGSIKYFWPVARLL